MEYASGKIFYASTNSAFLSFFQKISSPADNTFSFGPHLSTTVQLPNLIRIISSQFSGGKISSCFLEDFLIASQGLISKIRCTALCIPPTDIKCRPEGFHKPGSGFRLKIIDDSFHVFGVR